MTSLPSVRVLLIDNDPESISAVSFFLSEIKDCTLEVIVSETEFRRYADSRPKLDLLIFAHDSVSNSQELFVEILTSQPELYSIVLLPELDLETGKLYREQGARDGVYRIDNYLGNLRQALKKAFAFFWGNEAVTTGFLQSFEGGKKLLHYSILELLGAGIRTDVYKAEDAKENRVVAIKILPPSIANHTVIRRRLIRESLAASQLKHSSIGSVYAMEEAGGISFIVMEFLEGESLSTILRRGSLGMFRLLDIGAQISDALELSHQVGRIHGNIKPGNILLNPYGQAKLLDFGLPHKITPSTSLDGVHGLIELNAAGIPWDSLFYLSPEQTRGEDPDVRSDLFSFGSLLYFAATGEQPFGGSDPAQIIHRIQNEDPVHPSHHKPHLQEEFDKIVLRALAKDRSHRLQSASELRKVLSSLKSQYIPKAAEEPSEEIEKPGLHAEEVPPSTRRRIAITVAISGVLIVAIISALFLLAPDKQKTVSFAVLPVQFTDSDESHAYLSAGITDSLIEAFSMLSGLQVIQPVTIFHYRNTNDPVAIAEALKVKHFVVAKLQDRGEQRWVLEVQLMDAENGMQWSGQYSPRIDDLFSTRFDIAREISQKLNLSFDQEQQKFLMFQPAKNMEALSLYQHGRYLYYKHSREDLLSSIHRYDQAIELDPGFASAYSARSLSYLDLAELTFDATFYEKARKSATRALELQEKLSEGHTVLGAVHLFYEWDLKHAEEELKRSLVLNPNSSRTHSYLAMLLTVRQQPEAALQELEIATERDPLSSSLHLAYIRILTKIRKYDEAIDYVHKHADQIDPTTANLLLGDAYLGKKSIEEALLAYRRSQDLGSHDAVARIATVLAEDGMRREGTILLENLLAASSAQIDSEIVAAAYARLGNRAKALEWLRKSYQARSADLVLLKVDPDFDSLRDDPEFQKFLTLLGI